MAMGLDGETGYQPMNPEIVHPPQLKGKVSVEGHRCPYCHDEVVRGEGDAQLCDQCFALSHRECWEEHQGCAACGVQGVRTPSIKAKEVADPCGDCGGELGMISSQCPRCFKWFHQGCGHGHRCEVKAYWEMDDEEEVPSLTTERTIETAQNLIAAASLSIKKSEEAMSRSLKIGLPLTVLAFGLSLCFHLAGIPSLKYLFGGIGGLCLGNLLREIRDAVNNRRAKQRTIDRLTGQIELYQVVLQQDAEEQEASQQQPQPRRERV